MKKKIIYIVLIIIFICLYIGYRNNNLVFISKDDKEQLMEILEINEGTTFKPIYIKYISSGIHGSDPHYVVDFTSYMNDLVLNMSVRPENAKLVINCFYNEPTMNRKILMEKTGLKPTALKSVFNNLLEKNLIVENTGYSRNQIFTFEKYINL